MNQTNLSVGVLTVLEEEVGLGYGLRVALQTRTNDALNTRLEVYHTVLKRRVRGALSYQPFLNLASSAHHLDPHLQYPSY